MTDKWFNLNGKLTKNPTKEELSKYEPNQIIEYKVGTMEDMIIERWYVGNIEDNRFIDFAYQPSILEMSNISLSKMRRLYFKQHKIDDQVHFDKSYTLPPSYFTENNVKLPRYN